MSGKKTDSADKLGSGNRTGKRGALGKACKIIGAVFIVLGVVGLVVSFTILYITKQNELEYGIVMDAGSSHTSLYIYQWGSEDRLDKTGRVMEIHHCENDAEAISDYLNRPKEAGTSLLPCLKEAESKISWAVRPYTPVYLGATAGMRLAEIKDAAASNAIMYSVRKEIQRSSFQVTEPERQIQIISGKDEAVGLWITANYVAGQLGDITSDSMNQVILPQGSSDTLGVLDLGGASSQVAFATDVSEDLPSDVSQKVMIFNKKLSLFADSFLCFGANEIKRRAQAILAKEASYQGTVEHPCFAEGYEKNITYKDIFGKTACTNPYADASKSENVMTFIGSWNETKCQELISQLFNQAKCAHSRCSIDGRAMVPVPDRFLARGAYAYLMGDLKVLNATKQTDYETYTEALKSWCARNYSSIINAGPRYPLDVCVTGYYVHHMLDNVLQLSRDSWSGVLFTNKLNDFDMGWALGYMTNQTTLIPKMPKVRQYAFPDGYFIPLCVVFSLLIVIGLVMLIVTCSVSRKSYDMDKNNPI